jgi:hypothetical protein
MNKNSKNKTNYSTQMRKTFSNKDCILENGSLNHKYWHTKINQYWTDNNYNLLIQGIEEFGIGAWLKIKNKYLKNWVSKLF